MTDSRRDQLNLEHVERRALELVSLRHDRFTPSSLIGELLQENYPEHLVRLAVWDLISGHRLVWTVDRRLHLPENAPHTLVRA